MSGAPLLVTLVRHGAAEGPAHVFRGTDDPPLAPAGWAALRARRPLLMSPPISAVATSPLRRCRDFADELARDAGAPLAVVDDLREMAFGAWEGRSGAEAAAAHPARFAAFRADPAAATPPGGEPWDVLVARVRRGFAAAIDGRAGHVVVVGHAGPLRVLLAEWLGMPPTHLFRVALAPAAVLRVSLLAGSPAVLLWLDGAVEVPCAG
ncbi:MAG: histidine phosphatase family protein [bacterium]|nr:histidine phosphatase family protein [bacterium]